MRTDAEPIEAQSITNQTPAANASQPTNELKPSDNTIRDGWTQPGYISEVKGVHGALSFRYRPMLPEHVATIDVFIRRNELDKPVLVVHTMAIEIAKRLESWSNSDPISPDILRRQRYALLRKLYDVLAGYRQCDDRPDSEGDSEIIGEAKSITDELGN